MDLILYAPIQNRILNFRSTKHFTNLYKHQQLCHGKMMQFKKPLRTKHLNSLRNSAHTITTQ